MRGRLFFWVASGIFLLLFGAHFSFYMTEIVPEPWSSGPILLLFVLFGIFVFRAEAHFHKAQAHHNKLEASLSEARSIREDLQAVSELKDEIVEIRERIHSSDASMYGRIRMVEKDYDDAIDIFNRIVAESPKDLKHRYWLGLCYLRRAQKTNSAEDKRSGIKELRLATEDTEVPPDVFFYLGRTEFDLREYDAALEHLKAALERRAINPEETAITLAHTQKALSRNCVETDPEKAKEWWNDAKTTLENVLKVNPFNGKAAKNLAEMFIEEKDYTVAIDTCTRSLSVNARNWNVYTARAEALFFRNDLGDREKAFEDLERAQNGNKADVNIYRVKGSEVIQRALACNDKRAQVSLFGEAASVYSDGVKYVWQNARPFLYAQLSFAYLGMGRIEEAEKAAENACDISNHNANHLALCRARLAGNRWGPLQRAARKGLNIGGAGRAGRVFLYLFEIIGAVNSGSKVREISDEINQLMDAVKTLPSFTPQESKSWEFVQKAMTLPTLEGSEKIVLDTLIDYLNGNKTNLQLLAELENIS